MPSISLILCLLLHYTPASARIGEEEGGGLARPGEGGCLTQEERAGRRGDLAQTEEGGSQPATLTQEEGGRLTQEEGAGHRGDLAQAEEGDRLTQEERTGH